MINLIAESLKASGFKTEVRKNSVVVSLNRNISTMEVKMALDTTIDEIDDEIKLSVRSANGKVQVSL